MGFSIGMLGPLASGVMGAYGAKTQAKAQEQQYLAQARVAEQNKAIAMSRASESLKAGAREEGRFRRNARQFAASQEARLAASGRAMSGSALDVMADTASGIEQDAETIRYNTLMQKWGFDSQAADFHNEAVAARLGARSAVDAGKIAAASSLMSGFTGALAMYNPVNATAKGGKITISPTPATQRPANWGIGGKVFVPPDSQSNWWAYRR